MTVTRAAAATAAPSSSGGLSVVVCAYTFDRLELTTSCVRSLLAQDPPPDEVIIVVDHNEPLRDELARRFPNVLVVPNTGPQGLSGGRNTGVAHSRSPLVAFVDDDAVPADGWVSAITRAFDDPSVLGVGGHAVPAWDGPRPDWFPDEYLWVVGCSYRGLRVEGPVRNPIGCNMAFRTDVIRAVGGFNDSLGRIGSLPFGCEETEFSVRVLRSRPEASIVMVRGALVRHHVPEGRQTIRYLLERCYYEGIGKAILRRISDGAALAAERSYAARTLPKAVVREARDILRLHEPGLHATRIAVLVGGLAAAGIGYAWGLVRYSSGAVPGLGPDGSWLRQQE